MAACGAAHCAAAVCGVQNSQQGTQVSTNNGLSCGLLYMMRVIVRIYNRCVPCSRLAVEVFARRPAYKATCRCVGCSAGISSVGP